MRDGNKVLIVFLPHASLLLPERVLPDDDRSNPVFYQEVYNALAGGVQVVMNLPVALGGDAFHLPGDVLPVCFGKQLLQFLHALVVPLVPRFERPTVNQSRDKTLVV